MKSEYSTKLLEKKFYKDKMNTLDQEESMFK